VQGHHLTTIRRARYFTAGGGEGVSEVWLVIHGFGQLAQSFGRTFERVATPRRLIVAPEALNRFYLEEGPGGSHAGARVGATWMTREDRDADIADYVDWLDAVHAATVPAGARVTALGFSQGVATVSRWLTLGTRRAHRFVAWAGQLPPELDLGALRDRLDGGPLVIVRGTTDRYATWINEEENRTRLRESGIGVESLTFEGGHRLDDAVLDRLAAR
jgi:predicted esterase